MRPTDLDEFYRHLSRLEQSVGGKRILADCTTAMKWPARGVYFLFEPGERRAREPELLRVVRVGTHMVSEGSRADLWHRLQNHRGTKAGLGNHRGSVLRRHVGGAMLARSQGGRLVPTWGGQRPPGVPIAAEEAGLERDVSRYVGSMGVLWLAVGDQVGRFSDRKYIEKNAIGLLAGPGRPIDPPSKEWLGNHSVDDRIRRSGLWNVDYVGYEYDPRFLDVVARYVDAASDLCPPPTHSIAPPDWYTTT